MSSPSAPPSKPTLKDKGNQYYRQQQYSLASAMYRKYISKPHEDNKNAYYNLSLCYYKLQKYQECIQACQEALRIDAQFVKVYFRLALAYQKVGNVYQTFANAQEYCIREEANKDSSVLQGSVDYNTMKQLRDSTKLTMLYPSPIVIEERNRIFDYQHIQNISNKSNGKQNTANKQNINKQQQYFKGYTWSDVQNSLDNDNIRLALNRAYSIIRKQSKINNQSDQDGRNFEIVQNIKKGKCDKSTRLILQPDLKSNQVIDKQKNKAQMIKQQTKQIKQIKNETKTVDIKDFSKKEQFSMQEPIRQDIYTQYFVKSLEKKIDIFEGFLTVVISILQNNHLETTQKQQILTKASKQYQMFMALQFSLSSKQKQEIRKQMNKLKIKPTLIDVYCS